MDLKRMGVSLTSWRPIDGWCRAAGATVHPNEISGNMMLKLREHQMKQERKVFC